MTRTTASIVVLSLHFGCWPQAGDRHAALPPALTPPEAAAGLAAAQQPSEPRVRPPASIECARDHVTAYTGRVIGWSRTKGRTTIRLHTDWDTDESATLRHPGTDDPSRWFLLRGEPFKPSDWTRIESARGRLQAGTRATIWACDDGRPVVIDWQPSNEAK